MSIVLALAPGVAQAKSTGGLAVGIDAVAMLVDRGQAAIVGVEARCPAGNEVLEAFVYVSQRGNQSEFAPIPLGCDGVRHSFQLRVESVDRAFREGRALASAYILIQDPGTGETQETGDARLVDLRR